MEYVVLVVVLLFVAASLVDHHRKDVEEDPVENWEPPKELHIEHSHEHKEDKK